MRNIKKFGRVLVEMGVFTERELHSRGNIAEDIYMKTVEIEAKTILIMIRKSVLPRAYALMESLSKLSNSAVINSQRKKLEMAVERLITESEEVERRSGDKEPTLLDR
jgi:glutamine synthetase type III